MFVRLNIGSTGTNYELNDWTFCWPVLCFIGGQKGFCKNHKHFSSPQLMQSLHWRTGHCCTVSVRVCVCLGLRETDRYWIFSRLYSAGVCTRSPLQYGPLSPLYKPIRSYCRLASFCGSLPWIKSFDWIQNVIVLCGRFGLQKRFYDENTIKVYKSGRCRAALMWSEPSRARKAQWKSGLMWLQLSSERKPAWISCRVYNINVGLLAESHKRTAVSLSAENFIELYSQFVRIIYPLSVAWSVGKEEESYNDVFSNNWRFWVLSHHRIWRRRPSWESGLEDYSTFITARSPLLHRELLSNNQPHHSGSTRFCWTSGSAQIRITGRAPEKRPDDRKGIIS